MIRSVVIDSREPAWIRNLNWFGAAKTVTAMDAGDLLAVCDDGAGLLIERKTPTDFLGSLVSQRMLIQSALKLAPYREQGFWPYVMITGDFYISNRGNTSYYRAGRMVESQVSFDAVWGELVSIQVIGRRNSMARRMSTTSIKISLVLNVFKAFFLSFISQPPPGRRPTDWKIS